MKITDIKPQKNNKDRMSVFVDNQYAFSLEYSDIILMGVKLNKEISKEDIKRYNLQCNYTKAREKALDVINRKSATKRQVCDKISKYGYDEEIILKVISELEDMGYIDDFRYSKLFAEDCVKYKKHGKRKIEQELKQRGVEQSIINDALNDFDFCEFKNISDIIKARFPNCDFSDLKQKQKVFRYFMYRGFNSEDILRAINGLGEDKWYE